MYVIRSKNGTMINVDVNVKNQLIEAFVKKATCGILVHMIVSVTKRI